MEELFTKVQNYKQWASEYLPEDRSGEWECDYPNWQSLYKSVFDFIATNPSINNWSTEHLDSVLYALARDNECEHIAEKLRECCPNILVQLATLSIKFGERDARWQLAQELGRLTLETEKIEIILNEFADDTDEYVRRHALMALARIKSDFTEDLALKNWHQFHENQQWSRMAVLWSLQEVNSSYFETFRLEAESDSRPYLSEYAKNMTKRV
jgi:hypothetical protein